MKKEERVLHCVKVGADSVLDLYKKDGIKAGEINNVIKKILERAGLKELTRLKKLLEREASVYGDQLGSISSSKVKEFELGILRSVKEDLTYLNDEFFKIDKLDDLVEDFLALLRKRYNL